MSLETLLAAAWFVEQQDAQRDLLQTTTLSAARDFQLVECGSSKEEHVGDKHCDQVSPESEDCSSRKSPSLPVTLSRDKPNASAPVDHDSLSKALDNLTHAPSWPEEREYNKRVAGTREVHNKLEKNRRAHLKECFEVLKRQLPPCPIEKKSSNLNILHSALRHIQSLRRKEREFEHEMERLAREKISAQQKLAILKKELSTQWEHIDFSTLLPDTLESNEIEGREEQCSVSTSTATEEGLDWITTQNDFEDDDGDVDIISDSDEASKLNSNTSSLSGFAMPTSPTGLPFVELYTENPKTSSQESVPASAHVVPMPLVSCKCSLVPRNTSVVSRTVQLISSPVVNQPLAITVHQYEDTAHTKSDPTLHSSAAFIDADIISAQVSGLNALDVHPVPEFGSSEAMIVMAVDFGSTSTSLLPIPHTTTY